MFKKYILLIYLFLQVSFVFSQSMNNTLYFLGNTPQSNKLNPAMVSDYDIWIGFPGLSSVYVNYNNNSFSIDDLLRKKKGIEGVSDDSVYIDVNKFHSSLNKTNYISFQHDNSLFSFGLRVKRSYFTFDISQKSDVMFGFNKDLITFIKDGNTKYLGKTLDIGNLQLNGSVYNQVSFGYAREFGPKKDFIFGARFNLLLGVANVKTLTSDVTAYTDEDATLVQLNARHKIQTSLPLHVVYEDGSVDFDKLEIDDNFLDGRFYSGMDNMGFGIDIGMQYKCNEDFTLSASVLDIGFIKWRAYVGEFTQNGSFDWKGNDWGQPSDPDSPGFKDFEELMKDLADSLGYKFKYRRRKNAYNSSLSPKLYIGGTYKVNKALSLGALSRTQYYYGNIATSITLSANAKLCRNISASVSYTAANNSYTNLGLGLTAKLGCMQIYMVTDNAMAACVTKAQLANFRFGINMLFGHKDRERKKKYKLREKERVRNL